MKSDIVLVIALVSGSSAVASIATASFAQGGHRITVRGAETVGVSVAGVGHVEFHKPEPGGDWATFQEGALPLGGTEVVEDGGFEAGSPNPSWEEESTNFGTPLCTIDSCGLGNGTGPHSGNWWAWFGGIATDETSFVAQEVTIPASTSAELSFWLEIPSAENQGFLDVSLGGDVVFSVTDADAGDFATYTEVIVDVSSYADGGTHELRFDCTTQAGGPGATSFFVDDVSLLTVIAGGGEGLTPVGLAVDPPGPTAEANGVFEPGETVDVAPAWHNDSELAASLGGTATSFTGPEGAAYGIDLDAADYGLIEPDETASCLDTEVCYRLTLDDPATRPAAHWDAAFDETLDDPAGITKTWTLHIGDSFTDVPRSNLFYPAIETLLHSGVTGGCGDGTAYCPADTNTRSQMPAFMLRALMGPDYTSPPCVEGEERLFADVQASNLFCPWIEDLASRGIVAGCGGDNYCPSDAVTRAQMAVFLLKTLEGPDYVPTQCTNRFTDVPCSTLFADWIEDLAVREITGGCSETEYCPADAVSRGQMAAFITRAFGLTLYGPSGPNNPPAVAPATFSLAEHSAAGTVVGTVTVSDPDAGQTHTLAIAGGNTGGAFALDDSSGELTVANGAALDFETTPTFSLTVEATDDGVPPASGTGTVTVSLTDVDDPPTATDDAATVIEGALATTLDVLANDGDVDGGPISIAAVIQPAGGTVVNNATDLSYTPNPDFCNDGAPTDDFTYTLAPGGDVGTVRVTVTCVNDPPIADDPAFTITNVDPDTGTVTGTIEVTDPDGDALTYTLTTDPNDGTVTVDETTGDWTYTPTAAARLNAGLTEGEQTDDFTVTVTDGEASVDVTATLTISEAHLASIATVGAGDSPTTIAVHHDGTRAYVTNLNGHTVSVIDTSTNTVTATISVGFNPVGVAVHPDGTLVYVANQTAGTVSVIDTTTNTVTTTIPVGTTSTRVVAVHPDGARIYVGDFGDDTVWVIDTETNTVTATITGVGKGPFGVAMHPDGIRAYVTNLLDGTVSVIDTDPTSADFNTVIATITVGGNPNGVAVHPDGSRAYATNLVDGVSVIDTETNTVTGVILIGDELTSVALHPDGSLAYVTKSMNDSFTVIDTATNSVIASFAVGDGPQGLAVHPDGGLVYVPYFNDDTVGVIGIVPGPAPIMP